MSIHQEAVIAAAPPRVYEVLTSGQQFSRATGHSAELSDRPGETFSVFGGYVEGRQLELVPDERVVQAWRFGSGHDSGGWEPGVYSVVRFGRAPEGDGTRLVIDHVGVPAEWHDHVSTNYPMFYQDPISRYFAA